MNPRFRHGDKNVNACLHDDRLGPCGSVDVGVWGAMCDGDVRSVRLSESRESIWSVLDRQRLWRLLSSRTRKSRSEWQSQQDDHHLRYGDKSRRQIRWHSGLVVVLISRLGMYISGDSRSRHGQMCMRKR